MCDHSVCAACQCAMVQHDDVDETLHRSANTKMYTTFTQSQKRDHVGGEGEEGSTVSMRSSVLFLRGALEQRSAAT